MDANPPFRKQYDALPELVARIRARGHNPDSYYLAALLEAVTARPYRRAPFYIVPDWYESLPQYERPALFSEVAARG